MNKFFLKFTVCFATIMASQTSIAVDISAVSGGSLRSSRIVGLANNDSSNSTLVVTILPVGATLYDWTLPYNCPIGITGTTFEITTDWNTGWIVSGSCRKASSAFVWHNTLGVMEYNIVNTTSADLQVRIVTQLVGDAGNNLISYDNTVTVPKKVSCSASINNIDLGTIPSGSSVNQSRTYLLGGTVNSTAATLKVTGNDIKSDGVLYLGGTSSGVKVSTSSNNISGNTWNLGSSSSTAQESKSLILNTDASNGKAGTWSSSLLATLTCS